MSNNYSPICFNFNCFKCQEILRIHLKYIKDKKEIMCPNCGSTLPTNVFDSLKEATNLLDQAIINLELSNQYNSGWNFSLQWDLNDYRPSPPSAYNTLEITQEDIEKYHKPFEN